MDSGNTIVVIEHNLDIIKVADYIIDLGPEGGDKGGEVVVCGTPEEVAACETSYTGKYLKKYYKPSHFGYNRRSISVYCSRPPGVVPGSNFKNSFGGNNYG